MKKYFKLAFIYAILAMVCGVFYREFTKIYNFTGKTTLSVTHLHFFVLGTVMMLILGILTQHCSVESQKLFKPTMILYNVALPYMVVMFIVRGILQTVSAELSSGANLAISGLAGLGHIALGTAIILLFVCLFKSQKNNDKQ